MMRGEHLGEATPNVSGALRMRQYGNHPDCRYTGGTRSCTQCFSVVVRGTWR